MLIHWTVIATSLKFFCVCHLQLRPLNVHFGLGLLNIYCERKINAEQIADLFARKKDRRLPLVFKVTIYLEHLCVDSKFLAVRYKCWISVQVITKFSKFRYSLRINVSVCCWMFFLIHNVLKSMYERQGLHRGFVTQTPHQGKSAPWNRPTPPWVRILK